MNEGRAITIGGHDYMMSFPTLGRIRQLGKLLEVDVLRDGIAKADYSKLFEDDNSLNALITLIFGDVVSPEKLLDEMSAGDVKFIVLAFFLKAQQIHATTSNGLNAFIDMHNQATLPKLQEGTPSTLPSIE